MKNLEKYEKEIKEMGLAMFAVKESGEAVECSNISCAECKFGGCKQCLMGITEWLYEEGD